MPSKGKWRPSKLAIPGSNPGDRTSNLMRTYDDGESCFMREIQNLNVTSESFLHKLHTRSQQLRIRIPFKIPKGGT